MSTRIEWCDETWNPMTGCTPVSEACEHCYAERIAGRHLAATRCPACQATGDKFGREFIAYSNCPTCHGTGNVGFAPTLHPSRLDKPLRWRKPRCIFVCSMSDLFHEAFTDEQRDVVLSRVALCPHHVFMLLTKRPEAMREYFARYNVAGSIMTTALDATDDVDRALDAITTRVSHGKYRCVWPLPNLYLGVTAENQQRADERIPILLDTPAAVRFVSLEPMLSAVDLTEHLAPRLVDDDTYTRGFRVERLSWVILGGETGPGARPMQPAWALDVYRQCKAAGVPFFWKQAGSAWMAGDGTDDPDDAAMVATREFPEVPHD